MEADRRSLHGAGEPDARHQADGRGHRGEHGLPAITRRRLPGLRLGLARLHRSRRIHVRYPAHEGMAQLPRLFQPQARYHARGGDGASSTRPSAARSTRRRRRCTPSAPNTFGRDVLTRVLHGGRVSFLISGAGVALDHRRHDAKPRIRLVPPHGSTPPWMRIVGPAVRISELRSGAVSDGRPGLRHH